MEYAFNYQTYLWVWAQTQFNTVIVMNGMLLLPTNPVVQCLNLDAHKEKKFKKLYNRFGECVNDHTQKYRSRPAHFRAWLLLCIDHNIICEGRIPIKYAFVLLDLTYWIIVYTNRLFFFRGVWQQGQQIYTESTNCSRVLELTSF